MIWIPTFNRAIQRLLEKRRTSCKSQSHRLEKGAYAHTNSKKLTPEELARRDRAIASYHDEIEILNTALRGRKLIPHAIILAEGRIEYLKHLLRDRPFVLSAAELAKIEGEIKGLERALGVSVSDSPKTKNKTNVKGSLEFHF